MSETIIEIFEKGGGEFISPPSLFIDKLKKVKAVLFDWDGVFNNGFKQGNFGSVFSEVDSMGTNMLRYALWRASSLLPATAILPVTAIITGENNPSALQLAQRENFHAVYSYMKNKGEAFSRFMQEYKLQPSEVLFFFDDVLDLSVAQQCGVRIMIGRKSTPLFTNLVKNSNLAEYITANDGGHHGLREGMELVVGLLGQFEEVVKNRMNYSENYQSYLAARRQTSTSHVDGSK
jgi:3-deoxy-D-manno-octulosonate 8-phosphate phosphatase (KDO 8-P phosphatase)